MKQTIMLQLTGDLLVVPVASVPYRVKGTSKVKALKLKEKWNA